jgi:hypothetical protein
VFQQTIDILMGTNCAPLLADLFLHAYKTDFLQGFLNNKDGKLSQTFNFNCRYIDDVLSLMHSKRHDTSLELTPTLHHMTWARLYVTP